MAAEITINGTVPTDPKERVVAMAAAAEALSRAAGTDPADAVSTLLCAAAKIAMSQTDERGDALITGLATALGSSIAAASYWFPMGEGDNAIH